ncbi:MAG: hypothetical protein J1F01_10105 [Oscillospiraceae bacterium]|nr:hypothetical protein [Oscillospiraceae bacterium]
MMNELELKNAYRVSEDNVPVNSELKQRLITMAKAYDFSEDNEPLIKVVSSNPSNIERKRIRRRIIKYAAFAACFAVCAVSVTQISKYMDSDEIYPVTPGITTPAPDNGNLNKGNVNNTAGTGQNSNSSVSGQNSNAVGNRQNDNAAADNGQSGRSGIGKAAGTYSTAGTGSSYNPSSSATGAGNGYRPSTQTNNAIEQGGTGAINNNQGTVMAENPSATSGSQPIDEQGKGTEPGKNIESDTKESNTHDEFNSVLEALSGQRSKLAVWDNEIRPLKDVDEFIGMYYASFSTSMDRYINAADAFEAKHSSASDENAYSEAIREYDSNLSEDSDLYSDCRNSYRKAVNYIEMNDIAATDAGQGKESEPEEETAETEIEKYEAEPEEHEAEPEVPEDEA